MNFPLAVAVAGGGGGGHRLDGLGGGSTACNMNSNLIRKFPPLPRRWRRAAAGAGGRRRRSPPGRSCRPSIHPVNFPLADAVTGAAAAVTAWTVLPRPISSARMDPRRWYLSAPPPPPRRSATPVVSHTQNAADMQNERDAAHRLAAAAELSRTRRRRPATRAPPSRAVAARPIGAGPKRARPRARARAPGCSISGDGGRALASGDRWGGHQLNTSQLTPSRW